jgi:branched-chain amino acid transport system substrate-binding protein
VTRASRRTFVGTLAAVALARPADAQPKSAPYKLGVTYPLTGSLAQLAHDQLVGAQIAVYDVNRAGGIGGHPLALAVEDTQGTPQGGVAAMRKLVQADGVQAIVTVFTNVVTAQMPLGDQLKVPTLSTVQTPGLVSRSQYSFANSQTVAAQAALLRGFWKANGYRRIFAFFGNNAFGQLVEPIVKGEVAAAGAEYGEAFLDLDGTDFRGPIARAKDYAPDGVFIYGQGSTAETTAIKQIRELGITVPIFNGSNSFYDKAWREACGPYSEKMYFTGVNVDPKAGRDFIRAFKAKEGHPPSYQAGQLYDSVRMYAWAIAKGGYTGEGIRGALLALAGEVPSVFGGGITMGADHYTVSAAVALWQVRSGNEVKVPTAR